MLQFEIDDPDTQDPNPLTPDASEARWAQFATFAWEPGGDEAISAERHLLKHAIEEWRAERAE